MTTLERAELLRLLAALCDGRLSDAEHDRLEAHARANPEARRIYLQYVDVHSRLVMHPGLAKSRKMPPKEAWAWAALEEAVGMERRAAAWNARRRARLDVAADRRLCRCRRGDPGGDAALASGAASPRARRARCCPGA